MRVESSGQTCITVEPVFLFHGGWPRLADATINWQGGWPKLLISRQQECPDSEIHEGLGQPIPRERRLTWAIPRSNSSPPNLQPLRTRRFTKVAFARVQKIASGTFLARHVLAGRDCFSPTSLYNASDLWDTTQSCGGDPTQANCPRENKCQLGESV